MTSLSSWSALYEAQLARYQAVFDADHNMDAKSGVMLGASLAVAVFVLNKGLFSTNNKVVFAALILGCFLYLGTVGAALYVLKPRNYTSPANATSDRQDYLTMQDPDLMYQLIVDTEYATENIQSNLKGKAIALTSGIVCFMGGTLTLLVVKLIAG